ncbi:MAG: response regulator transcription factor [Ilumatobacteraceae bacterium]
MSERQRVFVHSDDPILQAGLSAQLRGAPGISVTEDVDVACVAVLAADRVDSATINLCRNVQRNGATRVVIVATFLDEQEILAGVEAGASGFLRRADAHVDRLAAVVLSVAAGEGSVPPDLIEQLLTQMNRMRSEGSSPRGITLSGFTERELEVLRLVAEGHETAEIARKLCYSERTVKGVIHEITSRFQLKNRAQAVAYAMRQGVI